VAVMTTEVEGKDVNVKVVMVMEPVVVAAVQVVVMMILDVIRCLGCWVFGV
jgi:hypothetical protein